MACVRSTSAWNGMPIGCLPRARSMAPTRRGGVSLRVYRHAAGVDYALAFGRGYNDSSIMRRIECLFRLAKGERRGEDSVGTTGKGIVCFNDLSGWQGLRIEKLPSNAV